MPFLLRIILQRVLLFAYSILAFLGIAPQVNIPSPEAVRVEEIRREAVADLIERQNKLETENSTKQIAETLEKVVPEKETKPPSAPPIAPAPPTTESPAAPIAPPVPPVPPESTAPLEPAAPITPEPITPPTAEAQIATVEDVVVNIICTYTHGNYVNVSTGSGIIVSPRGVVLTNAHVAQFFVLESYDPDLINCAMYKENIPTYGYKGQPIYVSPKWIEQNYELIANNNARGTGEDDYALILITGNTNSALGIPETFPSANPDAAQELDKNDNVIVAGYPGGPKSLLDLGHAGRLRMAAVSILDIFTFGGNRADVITTSKSEVGAQGASGGGIFYGLDEESVDLIGVIATTDGSDGKAKINGITLSYIERDIKDETGKSLSYFIGGNLKSRAAEFKDVYTEDLAKLLLREI
ncbi:MAG TPA: serine protease [Candidatus Paceibacterota bacterium]|nr:serine protease [Candidatus Paceibacterota bacterium]HRZ34260.1 serine protease [Candidatus Paceibacterota bacterium]